MEPQYVLYRTPRGCALGILAALVAALVATGAWAFGLDKLVCVALAAPPTGIILAISLRLDRRRGRE